MSFKPSHHLHIMCAKCGAYNNMLSFQIHEESEPGEGPSVTIHCANCGELHILENAIDEDIADDEGQ